MNGWHYIGKVEDIPLQGARIVAVGELGNIAVFRSHSEQIYALADRCPHRQGPLSSGIVHGDKVTCPLHGWTIDLASGEALGADHGCTRPFAVRSDENGLYLQLSSNDG
ncbi:nitrite reductase small subunit NirD [Candidatus Magnetaquicoccus inordinatus]|uniref:nitrite reductase small subunit NirD n=1 Tax=Candidatus Magnetaquicoccus inordinatus TaxID=2496818 RepID=UPI00102B28BD|nr:nitrite reductase small subunit NirD [Candidatus Magnetaquicoccus inordinatus]